MNHDELMRGYCNVLDSCETRPRGELAKQHHVMLERLCRHARQTTEFYSKRLAPLFDANGEFRFEGWHDIPPLSRRELSENFEQLKSNDVPSQFGGIKVATTSGSTGQPVKALWTDTQVIATHCMGRRLHRWHNVDPSEFLVLIYARPLHQGKVETDHDFWAPVYKAMDEPGRAVNMNGQLPLGQIINRLEELKPEHLNLNPRMIYAIANDYLRRGTRPGYQVKSIGTFGETRTSEIDARVMEVFGPQPYARYTSDEVGHIAIECPDCRAYHVADEVVHVDVVDAESCPIAPGGVGQILTTPLYSYAMPLIKYELGDEVRLVNSNCHRTQSVTLSEITGRIGNLFVHPEGGKFRPSRELLFTLGEMLQAFAVQVVQRAPSVFLVRYQAPAPPTRDALRVASGEFQNSLGFRANVSFEAVSEIPAKANGKREDFLCEIDQNL